MLISLQISDAYFVCFCFFNRKQGKTEVRQIFMIKPWFCTPVIFQHLFGDRRTQCSPAFSLLSKPQILHCFRCGLWLSHFILFNCNFAYIVVFLLVLLKVDNSTLSFTVPNEVGRLHFMMLPPPPVIIAGMLCSGIWTGFPF